MKFFDMLCSRCDKRTEIMSMLIDPERHELRYRCSECEIEGVCHIYHKEDK